MLVAGASGAALLVSGQASSCRAQVASCPVARRPDGARSLSHTSAPAPFTRVVF